MTRKNLTIVPSVGDLDRTSFKLVKGDQVIVGTRWDYDLATVIGFGKESVKVKLTPRPGATLYEKQEMRDEVSFDKYGWEYRTNGNHGLSLYTVEEAMPRVIHTLATDKRNVQRLLVEVNELKAELEEANELKAELEKN